MDSRGPTKPYLLHQWCTLMGSWNPKSSLELNPGTWIWDASVQMAKDLTLLRNLKSIYKAIKMSSSGIKAAYLPLFYLYFIFY